MGILEVLLNIALAGACIMVDIMFSILLVNLILSWQAYRNAPDDVYEYCRENKLMEPLLEYTSDPNHVFAAILLINTAIAAGITAYLW